jgi:26S proteasome regulatory subunit N8
MTELKNKIPKVVTIHPLVLLSVVDHYNRVAKNTTKRVVGILLGQQQQDGDVVNVSNSFSGKVLV